MTVTITLTPRQAEDATVVGGGEIQRLCQQVINEASRTWADIAEPATNALLLRKLKAAPRHLREQIDAVDLRE